MRKQIKNFMVRQLQKLGRVAVPPFSQNCSIEQIALVNQYRLMKRLLSPQEMPKFSETGFRVYSQFEEDGILLYIFAVIGTTNRRVLELCAGDGTECMSANLIINHGWDGLLFDGHAENVRKGIAFFGSNRATFFSPPRFRHSWITRDNIDRLVQQEDWNGEIDLLSLDLDGNDYFIWKALNTVSPRVVICETMNTIPPERSLTMPYREDFVYSDGRQHREFRSASLAAMNKLAAVKGYRLVGGHRFGFNAIFLRNDVGAEYFPEVSVRQVWDCPYSRSRMSEVWPAIKDFPWQEV